jgi:hypothetical protein
MLIFFFFFFFFSRNTLYRLHLSQRRHAETSQFITHRSKFCTKKLKNMYINWNFEKSLTVLMLLAYASLSNTKDKVGYRMLMFIRWQTARKFLL